MDDDKKYDSSDIRSITHRAFLKLHFYDTLTLDYPAFIKGVVLDHPLKGKRKIGDSPLIHWFFTNENEAARLFTAACREYLYKLQLPADDLTCTFLEEGFSHVESPTLINHLLAINYDEKTEILEPHHYFASFGRIENATAFSYLLGKYIRFYRDGQFSVMDSREAYMMEEMIATFSWSGDLVTTIKRHGDIPGSTIIRLNSDHQLLEYLQLYRNKWLAPLTDS